MYEQNQLIVYGNSGVCRVVAVGTLDKPAFDKNREYYTLQPVYGSGSIYTPVDTKVFMRPIISRQEAEALIGQIPSIEEDVCTERSLANLRAHYDSSLKTHQCQDLVQLIKSVYCKNQDAARCGRRLGQVDQQYRQRAEELLYGEMAAALDIPRENVEDYIHNSINANSSQAL